MSDMTALTQERDKLLVDLYEGRIPKRVPIVNLLPLEFAIQYAGKDLKEVQWNNTILEEIADKVCQDFPSDIMPLFNIRYPSIYKVLGARNFVMGSNGFIQHPEVEGLDVADYDALIASPYDCIVEKVLPKLYAELDTGDSMKKAFALAKGFKAFNDEFANQAIIAAKLTAKYGYSSIPFNTGFCEAPFDFLSDQLRGFKGIAFDVRRIPDKVQAAVEVLTPLMIKMGMPPLSVPYGATFIPLHLAPYLRTKDFEKLYWPSFKKLIEGLKEAGVTAFIFAEQDWMRYLDYLIELPENTRIWFEYGDPKLAKAKLGKRHILTGFYPLSLLKTGTKMECIDKAKELIDIMAPGGKYFFSFDKIPVTADSVNLENFRAVSE
ncbi:MAG TPA: uroporphyrinogen decarboxylase family protein, partial [Desulfosporosinus sp.]|nr:uroporphyrinogen decarboxylase family protein [Desulfosporosinus sp.]